MESLQTVKIEAELDDSKTMKAIYNPERLAKVQKAWRDKQFRESQENVQMVSEEGSDHFSTVLVNVF